MDFDRQIATVVILSCVSIKMMIRAKIAATTPRCQRGTVIILLDRVTAWSIDYISAKLDCFLLLKGRRGVSFQVGGGYATRRGH